MTRRSILNRFPLPLNEGEQDMWLKAARAARERDALDDWLDSVFARAQELALGAAAHPPAGDGQADTQNMQGAAPEM